MYRSLKSGLYQNSLSKLCWDIKPSGEFIAGTKRNPSLLNSDRAYNKALPENLERSPVKFQEHNSSACGGVFRIRRPAYGQGQQENCRNEHNGEKLLHVQ